MTPSPSSDDVVRDLLFVHLFDEAERVRWRMEDVPFDSIQADAITPTQIRFLHGIALAELTTLTASRRFLHEFADDVDFSQWVSVWFYEETRHPQVIMRWLARVGDHFETSELLRGRAATPFMKSRIGTLVTNVISEMVAASGYVNLADALDEPVIRTILRGLAADEARHASGFYSYAKRELQRSREPDRDRATALKVLYLWLRDSERVAHPVNQFHEHHVYEASPKPAGIESTPTRTRVCHMVGTLVGIDVANADDVAAAYRALSPSSALAPDRG